jgi:hypothetical protein
MSAFEQEVAAELSWLLRAGGPPRAVRLTVREMVVGQLERGRLSPHDVSDAVESAVRAACRLARELDAGDELVDVVCRAALEAVRGQGGLTARWLDEATRAAGAALEEDARAGPAGRGWHPLTARLPRW